MTIAGFSFIGGSGSNMGGISVTLKPWSKRKGHNQDVTAVIKKFDEVCADIQEAEVFAFNPPSIPGLGMSAGLQMQLLDINKYGAAQMQEALNAVRDAAEKDKRIASVQSVYQGEVPQYRLDINRDKVKMQNLVLADIYNVLSAYLGGQYVNDFNEFGRVYEVQIGGDALARDRINDVLGLTVKNAQGEMVPMASFMTIKEVFGQSSVDRYNMYETASLTATPAHGVSSSTAIEIMENIVKEQLGNSYGYAWTGEAYQESQGGTTVSAVMLFAGIITLLVLAAQYESWTDPVAVVISMPTAILGTALGCFIMQQSVNIYTQIGLILLLGLSAKNAILIVEYARDFRSAGQDIRQSAADAGRIRFRPIMMTALAFIFGVMPMLFATGAGAASRVSLGTAVVFGMAVNAVVGTLFVPNFWELLQRFREKYLSGMFKGSGGTDSPSPTQNSDSI